MLSVIVDTERHIEKYHAQRIVENCPVECVWEQPRLLAENPIEDDDRKKTADRICRKVEQPHPLLCPVALDLQTDIHGSKETPHHCHLSVRRASRLALYSTDRSAHDAMNTNMTPSPMRMSNSQRQSSTFTVNEGTSSCLSASSPSVVGMSAAIPTRPNPRNRAGK